MDVLGGFLGSLCTQLLLSIVAVVFWISALIMDNADLLFQIDSEVIVSTEEAAVLHFCCCCLLDINSLVVTVFIELLQ